MTWDNCCRPQSWWGGFQWFLYAMGKNICEINCGNCICGSGSGGIRALSSDPALDNVLKDGVKQTVIDRPVNTDDCYCDHTFRQRIGDFLDHINKGRRDNFQNKV